MMESLRKRARILAPFVVVFALVGFFAWRSHTVSYHLAGMERAARIARAYDWPGPPLLRRPIRKSDKMAILMHQNPQYWVDSWLDHQAALVERGYLTKFTIALTNQSLSAEQIRTNADRRFPDTTNIAAVWPSTNQAITIVVPTKDIGQWKEFIAELDRRGP